jgi:hypothetical protein
MGLMNAAQLRDAMRKLPEPVTDLSPPFWEYWRHELWQHVVTGEDPFTFPSWPCVYHTMLVNHWKEYVAVEFEYLAQNLSRWESAILATGPEKPKDYFRDTLYSRNLIHQAYHIARWEDATGKRIEECDTILEFGGGYGAMALVVHRLGFNGKYTIIDSPEFSLLQQFYLANASVNGVSFNEADSSESDLMIACYSLSEVDLEQRDEFLERQQAASYLFLYSAKFVNYDNAAYFQRTMPPRGANRWTHAPIEHLPPASWYTFGC